MFVLESKNCVVAQTNPTRYNYYYRWAELLSNAILKLGSSGIKTTVPLPSSLPHSKLGFLLFITGRSYRGTILHGGGGGGKA